VLLGMQTAPSKSVIIGPSPSALGRVTARATGEFVVEARNNADRPSKQGGDSLSVKFSGTAAATVVNIEELPEGRYKVSFVAPNAGSYQVTVKMNGEHIKDSPFKLTVSAPSAQANMCKVSGKGLTRLTAGEKGCFQVTFIDRFGGMAPAAELDVRLKPEGVPIPGPDDPIEVPPHVQKIFKQFDKDGSGDVDFSELKEALALLGYGDDRKAAAVLLRRYDSDGGGLGIEEFTQLVSDMEMAKTTGFLMLGVSKTDHKSIVEVNFEVKRAANYDLHLGLAASEGGGFLEGSPFSLTVVPSKGNAENTALPATLVEAGLVTAVGEEGCFEFTAYDAYKNACIKGNDNMRVSTAGNDQFEANVVDLGTGKYEIRYRCDQSGLHKMLVTIGEKHVRGSPLTVVCKPGPMVVDTCEVLIPEEVVTTDAGTPNWLRIRARDRFGNVTTNVPPGISFNVEMRRRRSPDSDSPIRARADIGRLDASQGQWNRDGVFELAYVPASSGTFEMHVLCVRDVGIAEEEATKKDKRKKDGNAKAAKAQVQVRQITEEVPAFPTFLMEVAALGPDTKMSTITNASGMQHQQLRAGEQLRVNIDLRDRFGNPCYFPASFYQDDLLPLRAEMFKHSVLLGHKLNPSEAGPHELQLRPGNEKEGTYTVLHVLVRTGKFSVAVLLDGKHIHRSPIHFNVFADAALGRKCRLERLIPDHNPDDNAAARNAARLTQGDVPSPFVGKPYGLKLQLRDKHGNAIDAGGTPIELSVDAPPIIKGSELDHFMAPKLEQTVIDLKNGSYRIQITAIQAGLHMITVHVGGQEVIGSPLTLVVEKPPVLASTKVAGKSRGDTLFAVASAISNRGLNWAFCEWLGCVYEQLDALVIIRWAAQGLIQHGVRSAFNTWIALTETLLHVKADIARVRGRLTMNWVKSCFFEWNKRFRNEKQSGKKLALWLESNDTLLAEELLKERFQEAFAWWSVWRLNATPVGLSWDTTSNPMSCRATDSRMGSAVSESLDGAVSDL